MVREQGALAELLYTSPFWRRSLARLSRFPFEETGIWSPGARPGFETARPDVCSGPITIVEHASARGRALSNEDFLRTFYALVTHFSHTAYALFTHSVLNAYALLTQFIRIPFVRN